MGLFVSGQLGDNFPIRIILPIGFLLVSIATFMISMGGLWEIENVSFYVIFFMISGLSQSIGWPSYIAVMGNWFSKETRGLIFGLWCSCENIGNIGGNMITNLLVTNYNMNWMEVFRTIAILVAVCAIINLILLIEHPSKVGLVIDPLLEDGSFDEENKQYSPNSQKYNESSFKSKSSEAIEMEDISKALISENKASTKKCTMIIEEEKAISFWKALCIPGVIQYAACIAFVKCSTYGILFWLPSYAKYELDYSQTAIKYIAISYDVGVIIGSVIIGRISDIMYQKRAPVAF